MKKLTVEQRLRFAIATAAVLKALDAVDCHITYGELARAIGMADEDGWKPWHRSQISEVLYLLAAADRLGGGDTTIRFDRVVKAADNKPGQGNYNESRVVVDRA